jgi:hypothetical protein
MEPDYCLWGHHTSNYAMKSFACMIHGGSFAFNLCPIGGMGNIASLMRPELWTIWIFIFDDFSHVTST